MINQASEDIDNILFEVIETAGSYIHKLTAAEADYIQEQAKEVILAIIRTEKLKLLDEAIHQSTVNLKSAKAVAGWAELRKKQLEAEL